MRTLTPCLLLFLTSALAAESRPSATPEYGPTQVLSALRQLREQRGDPKPQKLAGCLKNSSDGPWSDLQAHFYCWLKADQRACFTGAVDGEFKDHPELKGNYDMAFGHCQEAKGRAYGINFDRPLARLSIEQGEVFKNLLYRRPIFSKDDQRKILEAFYAGPVPERKAFPAAVAPAPAAPPTMAMAAAAPPPAPVQPAAPAQPTAPAPPPLAASPTMANPDNADEEETPAKGAGYPRSCQVKSQRARTRLKPDANSNVVAVLDPSSITVTGPAVASSGADVMQWYPVAFTSKGKVVNAYLAVSLVDCSN